ncbi:DUF6352 family protein [Qingshengfaniella alkalisoli]|uniref:Uncharacterized protein n=1 Tax=Qingshengfaniella alkalisoli TaxID=2599296 RepID=A0A5B8I7K1_9RHOB|nr:DUF6352 family protein [Qingshengfaniella alkalisoli]QDY69795.1 hypothetical protein FPZ52_09295 [Qingshengfaniella alkalisoli]
MPRDFWKSSGFHLVSRDENGWLTVTDDLLRAYLTRPEIHPIEDSCPVEIALFDALMQQPRLEIPDQRISQIADKDTADNYRMVLAFRDHLVSTGTVERAYSTAFEAGRVTFPPVFLDQMAHLILRNILNEELDPLTVRAAELFFRPQRVRLGEDQLMLADAEIVDLRSDRAGQEIAIDVLTPEMAGLYWPRSDKFDTALDFRFTQPAQDALARVIRLWVRHFTGIETRIQAMQSIRDTRWSWHIGCDATATRLLNALYSGDTLDDDQLRHILALFRMEVLNPSAMIDTMRGKPIYLGLAFNERDNLVFKPQNLLKNLPIGLE